MDEQKTTEDYSEWAIIAKEDSESGRERREMSMCMSENKSFLRTIIH